MYTLELTDEEIVERILIGSVLLVRDQEDYWYNERLKPRKISEKYICRMPVFWPPITMSESTTKHGFRGIPEIRKKLSKSSPSENLSPTVILNRGLKMLLNVGYYEKVPGKTHDGTQAKITFIERLTMF